jgi:hypothetical protein
MKETRFQRVRARLLGIKVRERSQRFELYSNKTKNVEHNEICIVE